MFTFAHKGRGRAVVADIESGSAGMAILSRGKPSHIEALHRTSLPIEEASQGASPEPIATALSESAEKVFTKTSLKGKAAEQTYAIIHAPWVKSKTVCAEKHFEKEEKISAKMIKELAEEALASEKELDRSNLFEATVIRIELNGYPTGQPEGKYAHSILLRALMSECDPNIRKSVEETLAKFSSSPPILRSAASAFLALLREKSISHTNCLIVDVTGTSTNLIVVHEGAPADHALIPEGTRTILKRIAGKGSPEETLSLIRMIDRGHSESAANDALRTQMANAEQELVRVFGETMATLATHRRLPNTLLLAVDSAFAPWISQFLERIDFTQFTTTTKPFSVKLLESKDFSDLVALLDEPKDDTGLFLATALATLEGQST